MPLKILPSDAGHANPRQAWNRLNIDIGPIVKAYESGEKRSREELLRRARVGGGRGEGWGEAELMQALIEAGESPHGQTLCDTYNIDVTFGSVAVEVCFGSPGRLNCPSTEHDVNTSRIEAGALCFSCSSVRSAFSAI